MRTVLIVLRSFSISIFSNVSGVNSLSSSGSRPSEPVMAWEASSTVLTAWTYPNHQKCWLRALPSSNRTADWRFPGKGSPLRWKRASPPMPRLSRSVASGSRSTKIHFPLAATWPPGYGQVFPRIPRAIRSDIWAGRRRPQPHAFRGVSGPFVVPGWPLRVVRAWCPPRAWDRLQRVHDLGQGSDSFVDLVGGQRAERQPDEGVSSPISEEVTPVCELDTFLQALGDEGFSLDTLVERDAHEETTLRFCPCSQVGHFRVERGKQFGQTWAVEVM